MRSFKTNEFDDVTGDSEMEGCTCESVSVPFARLAHALESRQVRLLNTENFLQFAGGVRLDSDVKKQTLQSEGGCKNCVNCKSKSGKCMNKKTVQREKIQSVCDSKSAKLIKGLSSEVLTEQILATTLVAKPWRGNVLQHIVSLRDDD